MGRCYFSTVVTKNGPSCFSGRNKLQFVKYFQARCTQKKRGRKAPRSDGPPTVIDPLPPGSLRTLVRQKTLATAYYFIRKHLCISPPPPPAPQGSRFHHLKLPPSRHLLPQSARKPRSGRSYASRISLEIGTRSSCGLYPSPTIPGRPPGVDPTDRATSRPPASQRTHGRV